MAVLLVALDYKMEARVGPAGALEGGYAGTVMRGTAMGEGKEENAFRYFLSKLVRPSPHAKPLHAKPSHAKQSDKQHRKEDFTFILDGILATLAEYHTSLTNGYLPGGVGVGKKDIGCLLQTCTSLRRPPVPLLSPQKTKIVRTDILLWRLVDLNKRFKAHLLEQSGKTVDLVVYILVTCLELKDDPGTSPRRPPTHPASPTHSRSPKRPPPPPLLPPPNPLRQRTVWQIAQPDHPHPCPCKVGGDRERS